MRILRRLRRGWPLALLLIVISCVYAAWPGRSKFTISPETTHVTEPVDAEGYVDYPTALNQRLGRGITPETNAIVLIWQALGPRPEGSAMPPAYFEWLGIPSPPDDGEYLLADGQYFTTHLQNRPQLPEGERGVVPDPIDAPPAWQGGATDARQAWFAEVAQASQWPWKAAKKPDIAA